MLQEAVDSLIDNGRRGRAVSGSGNHKLKSLSDMLKGKQGRFRQNLLGKRVDYAGRSVIVVGPELKLHQCGLPKRMALELFKPFIMHELVTRGLAHNIKSAKRVVERARPEVWDVLDDVVKQRPVLLNRAPTLHRLGIQAFEPVLVDGSALQIHPLVCSAFNADFDGDQMAVHVPLSREAVAEARQIMLSSRNLLLPSSGEPVIAPTLDMVMGCYYATLMREDMRGAYAEGPPARGVYGSFEEARLAESLDIMHLHAPIRVRDARTEGEFVTTTVGRILFDEVVPADLPFQNHVMDKKALKELITLCYRQLGHEATAEMADQIKRGGFRFATRSGITIAVDELRTPVAKQAVLDTAEKAVAADSRPVRTGVDDGGGALHPDRANLAGRHRHGDPIGRRSDVRLRVHEPHGSTAAPRGTLPRCGRWPGCAVSCPSPPDGSLSCPSVPHSMRGCPCWNTSFPRTARARGWPTRRCGRRTAAT